MLVSLEQFSKIRLERSIHDVYKDARFNKEVDQETGYKTKI